MMPATALQCYLLLQSLRATHGCFAVISWAAALSLQVSRVSTAPVCFLNSPESPHSQGTSISTKPNWHCSLHEVTVRARLGYMLLEPEPDLEDVFYFPGCLKTGNWCWELKNSWQMVSLSWAGQDKRSDCWYLFLGLAGPEALSFLPVVGNRCYLLYFIFVGVEGSFISEH